MLKLAFKNFMSISKQAMWSGVDGCRSSTLQPSGMAKHAADNYLTEETIIKQFTNVKTVDKVTAGQLPSHSYLQAQ